MSKRSIRVHYFQHVPFEGLGSIESWLKANSARVSVTRFYESASLPDTDDIDWLIVMGGPMSFNDEQMYPWLQAEKEFIVRAMKNEKIVLGVCLGAQLIASALGAKVYPNKFKEIGWFPIQRSSVIEDTPYSNIFPSNLRAFHWHGETFDLPENAILVAQSEGCKNQAFSIGNRVLGLQFHLESTPDSLKSLIDHCRDELVSGPYIQSELEMLEMNSRLGNINAVMDDILEYFMRLD